MDNIALGKHGEDLAVKYLINKGYQVLERNFRRPWGELDIIARFSGDIVFIEVKTQNKNNRFFIRPEENITIFKQRQLIKAAQGYLAKMRLLDRNWRIDVVAIEVDVDNSSDIRHIENAIND